MTGERLVDARGLDHLVAALLEHLARRETHGGLSSSRSSRVEALDECHRPGVGERDGTMTEAFVVAELDRVGAWRAEGFVEELRALDPLRIAPIERGSTTGIVTVLVVSPTRRA